MAADMFLKLGDIKGESTDDKHKDEIEILNFGWGIHQTGTMASGGGGGTGKATFADFSFSHTVDKASANLMKMCALGEHIKEATFTARKAGKGQQEYFIVKMNDIIVTSVVPSGSGGDVMHESFTLQVAKWDVEYKPQKADGSLDAGIHFKYDQKLLKEA